MSTNDTLKKLVYYLKDFRDEGLRNVKFLEKGAILRTSKGDYYVKFDTMYWHLAGRETGRFSGPGFALNTSFYNIINNLGLDVLYTTQPNIVYYYHLKNYQDNSFYHTQEYNGEKVRVISIENADDIWKI